MPNRRTLIVLAALLLAMTTVSALLLMLEPGPVVPLTVLRLSSLDSAGPAPEDVLFQTTPPTTIERWSAIIVRTSGAMSGSAASLHQDHERDGRDGLGYHFVIGNGDGAPDGQIQIGYRWRHQFDGDYARGENANWFNRHALSICLIGDGYRAAPTEAQLRELVWLVQRLQARLGIGPDRVLVEARDEVTGSIPRLFPVAAFRQQLLMPAGR